MGLYSLPVLDLLREQRCLNELRGQYSGKYYQQIYDYVDELTTRARAAFQEQKPRPRRYTYEEELPQEVERAVERADKHFLDKLSTIGITFSSAGRKNGKKVNVFFMP